MSSTSKIKNTIAKIKKCKEKGIRNSKSDLNPHSNGLWNSRSNNIFLLIVFPKKKINIVKVILTTKEIKITFIY